MLGENGAFGSEAEEIVETILGSSAMTTALATNNLAENPFDITLSASDNEELSNVINAKLRDADATTAAALRSLANLFGVTL
jgi:hypothetical protein